MPDLFKPPRPPCPASLPASGERIQWLMTIIGWGPSELAHRLGVDTRTAEHWRQGKKFMPLRAVMWLETLAQMHLALLRPAFWRQDTETIGKINHAKSVELCEQAWTDGDWIPPAALPPKPRPSTEEIRGRLGHTSGGEPYEQGTPADPWGRGPAQ